MKKTALATALLMSTSMGLSTVANADTLGFRIGANVWQPEFTGDVQSGTDALDLEDDLGYDDDESNNSFYVALEHPIPLIPNVMLARTELEIKGSSTSTFDFDGISFSGTIDSTTDLSHTDATLYYEILDNWISLDIGLTVRSFDEGFTITGTTTAPGSPTETAELEVDEVIPMLYIATKFELPLSGLYIIADANWISYDDDTLLDYKAGLGYETSIGLGIEAGIRSFEIEYEEEDDNEFADLTIDGIYAGVFYHF